MIRRAAAILLMASAMSAQAAPFDCKPKWILNGTGTEVIAHTNEAGRVIAWFCPGKKRNIVVVLKGFTAPGLDQALDELLEDPSHARMNAVLAKFGTLNPDSAEARKVWARYDAEVAALKAKAP